jgi:hypothetical protein
MATYGRELEEVATEEYVQATENLVRTVRNDLA